VLGRDRTLLPRRELAVRLDERDLETVWIRERQRALTEAGLSTRAFFTPLSSRRARQKSSAPGATASDTSIASPAPMRPGAICTHGKNVRSVPGLPSASA
jgi:hypothetical protein